METIVPIINDQSEVTSHHFDDAYSENVQKFTDIDNQSEIAQAPKPIFQKINFKKTKSFDEQRFNDISAKIS